MFIRRQRHKPPAQYQVSARDTNASAGIVKRSIWCMRKNEDQARRVGRQK